MKSGISDQNKSSLNLKKGESFNDDDKKNKCYKNDRFEDEINDYYRYKKYSKSLHYKKKKSNF